MNQAITIRAKVRFRRDQRNRKRIRQGPAPIVLPKGSVPRVSRKLRRAVAGRSRAPDDLLDQALLGHPPMVAGGRAYRMTRSFRWMTSSPFE